MIKRNLYDIYFAIRLFINKRGTTLAAASTFYSLITIVPLFLLLIRVIGLFIGDVNLTQDKLFSMGEKFFPDVAPEILIKIKEIVQGPLFGETKFTLINFGLLVVTSLSFFNSIWNGLYLITGDKSYLSLFKHLKGLLVIGASIAFTGIALFIPAIFHFIVNILQNNILVEKLVIEFPVIKPIVSSLNYLDIGMGYLVKFNLLHGTLFLAYFTFLYRWFFSFKISFKESFKGSLFFVTTLILGKNLFWIYMAYVRDGLINNYGDYYTVIVGIMWIYFVMCFFFMGACLCHKALQAGKEEMAQ
jgi:membrane protein